MPGDLTAAGEAALLSRYLHDPLFHARVTIYRRAHDDGGRLTGAVLAVVAALPEWTYSPLGWPPSKEVLDGRR